MLIVSGSTFPAYIYIAPAAQFEILLSADCAMSLSVPETYTYNPDADIISIGFS